MTKNLWQMDRNEIFRDLVDQYLDEGYSKREARKLAKQEADEIMIDKNEFVDTVWEESFHDR
jgi:hypothetical protein